MEKKKKKQSHIQDILRKDNANINQEGIAKVSGEEEVTLTDNMREFLGGV